MKNRSGFVSNSSSSSFICPSEVSECRATEMMECVEDFVCMINEKAVEKVNFSHDSYLITIVSTEMEESYLFDYEMGRKGYNRGDFVGKTVIKTTDDNSIPIEIATLIERILGVEVII